MAAPSRLKCTSFFFSSSDHAHDLHSFPTRRSSDLADGARHRAFKFGQQQLGLDLLANHLLGDRSEEHTSELQSHSDLVCRLLLEKKKMTVPMPGDALTTALRAFQGQGRGWGLLTEK